MSKAIDHNKLKKRFTRCLYSLAARSKGDTFLPREISFDYEENLDATRAIDSYIRIGESFDVEITITGTISASALSALMMIQTEVFE